MNKDYIYLLGDTTNIETKENEHIYVMGDADRIREKIESFLLNNQVDQLTKFSQALTDAIQQVKDAAIESMDAVIIMAGGDDILFYIDKKKYRKEYIQKLADLFYHATGGTLSFGVGRSIESSYLNLRRAKASNKSKIVEETFFQ